MRKTQKDNAEEEKKFKQFTQKPVTSAPASMNYVLPKEEGRTAPISAPKTKAEDELEIPAFIRKKMGI
jgi:hypothetical protein